MYKWNFGGPFGQDMTIFVSLMSFWKWNKTKIRQGEVLIEMN